jgi:peptidoglycan/xylan/chitin deacetylase (PgdA/CDA1 family)
VFAAHLAYLRLTGRQCVSLEEVAAALRDGQPLPRRGVVLTFDDGYTGIFRHALPVVRRFGWTATVFVPSRLIGQEAGPGTTYPVAKMDLAQIRALVAEGWSIGSHTRTHADLTRVEEAVLSEEIIGSRQDLETDLGVPITTFCYPYGRFNATAAEVVSQAGYEAGCTNQYGRTSAHDDPLLLPRVTVGDNLSLPRFIYRVARAGAPEASRAA